MNKIIQLGCLVVILLSCINSICAQEDVSSDALRRNWFETEKQVVQLRKQLDEQPELKKLKAELESAQKAYRTAFDTAFEKENPELFQKYKQLQEERINRLNPVVHGATEKSGGYDKLTEDEKKRVFEARRNAMQSVEVKEARAKRNAAKSEEERKAAEAEYKSALRKAMLEADNKLEELIDKLDGKKPDENKP